MSEIVFVGLGLFNNYDLSLRGLEEARNADEIYLEFYTSLMPGFSVESLKQMIGKNVQVVSRKMLEEEGGESILKRAIDRKIILMVPGDPLISTTHIDLRIRAEARSIKTRIVHGASIISAAISLSGLQNYRFGRSVTIPFTEGQRISETPYNVISENKTRDLHTLCFLDIRIEESRCMTIKDALKILLQVEKKKREKRVTPESLAVGIARAGAEDVTVKAAKVSDLQVCDFGPVPHTLVFPAETLHFMEAEALLRLAAAPEWVRGMTK